MSPWDFIGWVIAAWLLIGFIGRFADAWKKAGK